MNTIDLYSKYYPKTREDLISNGEIILNEDKLKRVKEWISNFYVNSRCINKKTKEHKQHSNLIIKGEHGIGKTVSILILLKELQHIVKTIPFERIKSKRDIEDNIRKLTTHDNIIDMVNSRKKTHIIVIDQFEKLISPIELQFVKTLCKLNEKKWIMPIIIITNTKHSSILNSLKYSTDIITFDPPNDDFFSYFVAKLCKLENIKPADMKTFNLLMLYVQYDVRCVISILQELKIKFGSKRISESMLESYLISCKKKDIDIDIFKSTNEIVMSNYEDLNLQTSTQLYDKDRIMLPLMIHENFIRYICEDRDEFIDNSYEISKSLVYGDIIENSIYNDQNWNLIDSHMYYTCGITSYMIAQSVKQNKKSKTQLKTMKIVKPDEISKSSIKNIHKSYITNIKLDDLTYVSQLIKQLINNKRYEECVKLMQELKIELNDLDMIFKVDKLTESNIELKEVKKKLKKIF